jgi:hypothetical protein
MNSNAGVEAPQRSRKWVLGASLLLSIFLGTVGGVALKRLGAAERGGRHDRSASALEQPHAVRDPSARKCPPALTLAQVPGDLVTDSTQPGYNPRALRLAGVSGQEIFDAEPAGTQWGKDMQSLIGTQIIKDVRAVVPEASSAEFVCKSTGCSLSWSSLGEELDNRMMALVMLAAIGPTMDQGNVPNKKSVIFFYPSPDDFPVDQPKLKEYFNASQPENYARVWSERRRQRYARFNGGMKQGLSRKYDAALRGVRLPE